MSLKDRNDDRGVLLEDFYLYSMQTDLSGSYVAIAGVIVSVLTHFGINTTASDIVSIISAIVIIVGIIKQMIAHKAVVAQANKQG